MDYFKDILKKVGLIYGLMLVSAGLIFIAGIIALLQTLIRYL